MLKHILSVQLVLIVQQVRPQKHCVQREHIALIQADMMPHTVQFVQIDTTVQTRQQQPFVRQDTIVRQNQHKQQFVLLVSIVLKDRIRQQFVQ